jgi:hypothetical protein
MAEMLAMGLLPAAPHYEQLLRTYAAFARVEEAAAVVQRMEAAGLPLSLTTFHCLLYAAGAPAPWAGGSLLAATCREAACIAELRPLQCM